MQFSLSPSCFLSLRSNCSAQHPVIKIPLSVSKLNTLVINGQPTIALLSRNYCEALRTVLVSLSVDGTTSGRIRRNNVNYQHTQPFSGKLDAIWSCRKQVVLRNTVPLNGFIMAVGRHKYVCSSLENGVERPLQLHLIYLVCTCSVLKINGGCVTEEARKLTRPVPMNMTQF
jgi:hypothetical protein